MPALALALPFINQRPLRSGGGAVLPSGAIGVWYADEYQSAPRKLIPNAVSAVAVEDNLLSYPRRLFNNTLLWGKSGATITDATVAFNDGTNDASAFVTAGAGWINTPSAQTTTTAGQFTMAIWVRSASGSNQDFRMAADFGGAATKTATTSWQRFTHTVTLTAAAHELLFVWTTAAATALNLEICDAKLYAGASAGTEYAPSGHMYLGSNHFDTKPTASGGELNLTAGGYGNVQFTADTTFAGATFMAVGSKTAVGSIYQSFFSRITTFATLTALFDESKGPTYYHNGSNRTGQGAGLWDFKDLGYHFLCIRFSGTQLDIFVDDMKVVSRTITVGSVTGRDFWVGTINSLTNTSGYKINSQAVYNSSLSDADIATARSALVSRAALSALTVTPIDRLYASEGDSITAATNAYPYIFGPNSSPKVIGVNHAVGGSMLATMSARASALDAILPTNKTGRKFILSVLIGANDLYSYTGGSDAAAAANYAAALAIYLDARRAAGWLVVAATVLPRSDVALTAPQIVTHNARRAILNPLIVAMVGVNCDGVADFAANTTMGDDIDSDNATYYSDKLHPTAAGQAVLEPIMRAAVNAL